MITKIRTRRLLAVTAVAVSALLLTADSIKAAIVAGATDQNFQNSNSLTNTVSSFTVASGTDRKLVLAASWEDADSSISATWQGSEAFSIAEQSGNGRHSVILYLDNPSPGTGNIVVTYGSATESRVGVVSLTGAADGVDVSSTNTVQPANTGTLTTTVDGTLVTGVYTINGGSIDGSPFSSTIYNGSSGSSRGNAGFQIEATAGLKNYTWPQTGATAAVNALAGFVPVNESPAPPLGEIAVIRSESLRDPGSTTGETISFDAGDGADKLVVHVSAEGGGATSVSYNGVPLTQVAGLGRSKGIFYLDDPFTGGLADLEVSFGAGANGIGVGVVSLAGTAPGVSSVATPAQDTSVTLDVLVDNSFVFAGYGAQGTSNSVVLADLPLTQIYGGDIGSAKGAAGYVNLVAAGLQNYSFSPAASAGSPGHVTLAAAFAPLLPVPEPTSFALAALGLMGLLGIQRRRDR